MSETVDSENEEGLVWQLIAGLQAEIATAKDRMVEMASEYEVVVDERNTWIGRATDYSDRIVKMLDEYEVVMIERDAAREALRPFARLVVPQKRKNNAGVYSLFFRDIEAAREALSSAGQQRTPDK